MTSAGLYVGCPVNLFPKEALAFSHKQVTSALQKVKQLEEGSQLSVPVS